MAQRLTDAVVKALPLPSAGNKIHYDSEVKGFGCRVTATGARAFILNYRTKAGRERRITIGSFPDWGAVAARQEASRLKQLVDRGEDPLDQIETDRAAPTIADLCARFEADHMPKLRPGTAADYKRMIQHFILPEMKHLRVAEVTHADVDALHRKITRGRIRRTVEKEEVELAGGGYRANRTITILGRMLNLAVRWGWRADNPARGIERNPEAKRQRYLTAAELTTLTTALKAYDDQQAANVFRLLLLTGARRGEVLTMRWSDLDLDAGVWTKPGATTKQKTEHRVPLSAAARQLLLEMRSAAESVARAPDAVPEFVFPGRGSDHRVDVKQAWAKICKAAGIKGARIHDLRHTYASVLASAGLSLPIIGALLGHTQPQTTARYAHLMDDPLRAATERAAAIVTGKPAAEVVSMPKSR